MKDLGLIRLIGGVRDALVESFDNLTSEGYKRATGNFTGTITEKVQRALDVDARGPGRFRFPVVGKSVETHVGALDMAPGVPATGKPITNSTRPFLEIFPELGSVNPGFKTGEWGFRHNCQSCAVVVDQRLAGKNVMAIRRPKPPADDWRWPDDLLKAVGTRNRFRPMSGFPEIERTLLSAGPEARGIIYGMRRDSNGKLVATHTFNVVNRKNRIYYVDGQHGGWANTEGYAELRLLRTN